jgi:hypothetical protein
MPGLPSGGHLGADPTHPELAGGPRATPNTRGPRLH